MIRGGFSARADQAVADLALQAAMDRATGRQDSGRRELMGELPDPLALRGLAGQIRDQTLQRLDRHLEQLAVNVERLGGSVHWAADGTQACQIILGIARRTGARRLVKSKSMLSEEIGLNESLTAAGLEVIETDLGEYILQLAGDRPSHIVAPAVHMTAEGIGRLFSQKLRIAYTEDPAGLTRAARRVLRDKFRAAQMGISGVNLAVAQSGAVCIVTNEGNGRFVVSHPPVHVALMGMERVVPTMRDLAVLLKVLARSATGQRITVYTGLCGGPRRPDEPDGPREFHLVVVDNGRSEILAGPFREVLRCIRCGACLNACPVYRKVGGHAYESVYCGPMGALLTPLLESIVRRGDLAHASSLCHACAEACPVRIDIPGLLIAMRAELKRVGQVSRWQRLAVKLWAWLNRSSRRYHASAWCWRVFFDARARGGWHARLPGPGAGWTRQRDFPAMAETPFHKLWPQLAETPRGRQWQG